MYYKEVISVIDKIYYSDTKQFERELNKVLRLADLDFPFEVKSGIPKMTTTKSCSDVYYHMSRNY